MQRILLSFALAAILGGCMSARRPAAKVGSPDQILDVAPNEALDVGAEALADGDIRFDERALVTLAGRIFMDRRYYYDDKCEHVADLLFCRPESKDLRPKNRILSLAKVYHGGKAKCKGRISRTEITTATNPPQCS